ncbi:MAG: hypothetical protein H8D45_31510, partial [Bacteroidetes bacterium]|nr:hypothetical protein [Bacteroidota bacterium]
MRNYHSFISGIIKFLLIGYLLIVFPVVLIAQWQYVKKIADSCTPSISNNYSFYEWQVGNHGGGYAVTRNGSVILTNEGSFGCCWVRALEPFTDSIVIFVQASKYPDQCSITVNEGNTWNCIDSWYDIYIQDWIFVNKNTCYFISKGYNWDGSRISIRRVSDIKSRYLIKNDSIDPAISIVELHDTIFGDPYCHDMDTIGFRILNDSIYIDFYIYLTKVPLAFNENSSSPFIKVFPNPVIEEL